MNDDRLTGAALEVYTRTKFEELCFEFCVERSKTIKKFSSKFSVEDFEEWFCKQPRYLESEYREELTLLFNSNTLNGGPRREQLDTLVRFYFARDDKDWGPMNAFRSKWDSYYDGEGVSPA